MLTTLVDLASFKSAKCHIKKWKSAKTGKGYLESVCEIWRREAVRFNFIGQGQVYIMCLYRLYNNNVDHSYTNVTTENDIELILT